MVKKSFWVKESQAKRIEKLSVKEKTTESTIVRNILIKSGIV